MSYVPYPRPCGDFRTSYAADMTMFRTRGATLMAAAGVALLLATPLFASDYVLSQLILIGIYGIAALGLNVLVGFTGQIRWVTARFSASAPLPPPGSAPGTGCRR